MQTTGDFEISESESMSVSGKIKETESSEADILPYKDTSTMELSNADVYKELRLRGYDYGSEFRGISAADINGKYRYICRFIFKKLKLTKYKNIQYLKKNLQENTENLFGTTTGFPSWIPCYKCQFYACLGMGCDFQPE